MATNPYVSPTQSGYNSDPPADDGSQTEANRVKWATVKTKLADPNKTFIEDVDSAALAAHAKHINTDDDENNLMTGSLAFGSSELTIATGAVTPTRSRHTIDTESDAASDDLDTMATGSVSDGASVELTAANTARTVVVKHEATAGAGDFHLFGDADFSLDDDEKTLTVRRRGTDWYEVSRSETGRVVQVVNTQDSAVATGTTTTPTDDSIPQNTEGDEYMTLAVTPKSALNFLRIEVEAFFSNSVDNTNTVALFQDSTANAIKAVAVRQTGTTSLNAVSLVHYMTAATASSTTFKVRIGGSGAGTTTFNGASGARRYGGVAGSSITITEIAA